MILSVAWKNIWRNKIRSSVVTLAIVLGLLGGTFSVALMKGMVLRRINSVIHQEVGHLQLHHPKFMENKDPEFQLEEAEKTRQTLVEIPGVEAASRRLILVGMASTARKNSGATIIGIFPNREAHVSDINQLLCDSISSYFGTKTRRPILVGDKLAQKLNLNVRSKVLLTLQGADGYQTGGSFRVVGIYKTDNATFNENNVFVRQQDLVKITGYAPHVAHEIAVLFNGNIAETEVIREIKKAFPTAKTDTYKSLMPDIAIMADYMDYFLMFFVGIILLALGFGIVNTMLMVVLERSKEFGMLMAIGMTRARVFAMVMLETIYLLTFGGTIGMLASHFLTLYFGQVGINLGHYAQGLEAAGIAPVLYPAITFSNYLTISLLILLTGILAAIYPSIKAIKLKPAEAIRTI